MTHGQARGKGNPALLRFVSMLLLDVGVDVDVEADVSDGRGLRCGPAWGLLNGKLWCRVVFFVGASRAGDGVLG